MVSYRPAAVTAALLCGTAAAFSPAPFIFPARPARAPSGGAAEEANHRPSRPTGAILRVASREETEITGGGGGNGRHVPPEIQRHMHLPLVPMPSTSRPAGARAADNAKGGIPSTNDHSGASLANGQHANAGSNGIEHQHVPQQHNQHTQSRPEAAPNANGGAGAQILNGAGSEYYSDDTTIGELALPQHGHEHHEHLVEDENENAEEQDSSRTAFLGDDNEDEFDVIIGPGSTLSLGASALTFPSTLLVQGTVTGQVECAASRDGDDGDATAAAAPGSKVRVSSDGSIEGDVLTVETVEVCAEGSIVGDVRCKCLKIAEGGEIVGDVTCESL